MLFVPGFANILAGHSILKLVSVVAASILPAHWAMEAGMALLQAYVFKALLLIYAGETQPRLPCRSPVWLLSMHGATRSCVGWSGLSAATAGCSAQAGKAQHRIVAISFLGLYRCSLCDAWLIS
jgi:hypothetical protein